MEMSQPKKIIHEYILNISIRLYNESPVNDTIVTNDRWGVGTGDKHGDFVSYGDHYKPGI